MQIRLVVETDYESVLRIMNQVQDIHVELRPDIYKENKEIITKEEFLEALEGDTFYVAEDGEKVIGIMGLTYRHIESSSHVTRDVIFVDSMAVDEPYRGTGVGHAFFDKLKELAREKHSDGIELQVNARNKQAYEMYAKYGFSEKSINMELLEW